MLQIQLGRERREDPAADPLGRSHLGWWPGMTEEEAWEVGRGTWKLNVDHALGQDEVQIVSPDGIVLAVARVRGITKTRLPGRYAIDGDLLRGDSRVGKATVTPQRSRNAVAYF
jgi:hypothetical protein